MFGRRRERVQVGHDEKPGKTIQASDAVTVADALPEGTRRLHMVFRGQVQGVGFRWTAQIKARNVGATGWVQNEHDGTVTMELQGTDEQIARFFGEFNRSYASYPIDYVIAEREDIAVRPDDTDFEVRFVHY